MKTLQICISALQEIEKAFTQNSVTLDLGEEGGLPAVHLGSLAVPPAFHEHFL